MQGEKKLNSELRVASGEYISASGKMRSVAFFCLFGLFLSIRSFLPSPLPPSSSPFWFPPSSGGGAVTSALSVVDQG